MFKSGMVEMLKQAKKMQEDMKTAQEELKYISCCGESASGKIKIDLNGNYMVTNIKIDNSLLSDVIMLEDLIMAAVNNASFKVSTISKEKMKNITGGLNLPF